MTITEFLLARIAEDEDDLAMARLDDLPAWWMPGWWTRERAQADIEAKRRIIERHSRCDDVSFGDASTCPDMQTLASIYRDHPDYREEWRP